jgi:hypothetical protein
VNVFISGSTFVTTNDNAALSIADEAVKLMHVEVLNNPFTNASSSIVTGYPMNKIIKTSDGNLYFTLQTIVAYNPVALSVFTIEVQGIILSS